MAFLGEWMKITHAGREAALWLGLLGALAWGCVEVPTITAADGGAGPMAGSPMAGAGGGGGAMGGSLMGGAAAGGEAMGGTAGPCVPSNDSVEICDGLDNDCDGVAVPIGGAILRLPWCRGDCSRIHGNAVLVGVD